MLLVDSCTVVLILKLIYYVEYMSYIKFNCLSMTNITQAILASESIFKHARCVVVQFIGCQSNHVCPNNVVIDI